MTVAELEQLTRREIDDEVGTDSSRFLKSWQMLAYLNEAETEACLRARLLVDSTNADICTIPIVAGTAVYSHDPRIFAILRGKLSGVSKPLGRVSYAVLDEVMSGWDDMVGPVETFVTGMDKGRIRLFRTPTEASTLQLTAVRLPLAPMTRTTDTPEIPTRFHPGLIFWIKHKVYNNQDSELFDRNRSDIHLALFERRFGPPTPPLLDVCDSLAIPRYMPTRHGEHTLNDYYF